MKKMFIKIPFTSDIKFKTNISEITKMSLEHDFNINDTQVLGNFYVSGEYKVHEISINKEPFNYTLPFTVELSEEIDADTIEFNIEDFSYDVVDDNVLRINIEYSLKGEERQKEEVDETAGVEFERVNEDELTSELSFIDDFLENDNKADSEIREEVKEEKEETSIEIVEEKAEVKEDELKGEEEKVTPVVDDSAREISKEEEKTVLETIKDSDDTFVTYHIHIVKESETLESIALMYNAPKSLLEEYNEFETITIGDKVLIPKLDE